MTLLLSVITNFGNGDITSKKSIMKTKRVSVLVHSISLIFFTISILISSSLQATNIKNSAVVFMYHKFNVSKYPSTNITLEQFESHLQEFSKSKYNVKSLDYIVDNIINDVTLPQNTMAITVDDADRSFLDVAWPRLKKLGFSSNFVCIYKYYFLQK